MLEHLFPKLAGKSRSDFLFAGLIIGFAFSAALFVAKEHIVQETCAETGHSYRAYCAECGYVPRIKDGDLDRVITELESGR